MEPVLLQAPGHRKFVYRICLVWFGLVWSGPTPTWKVFKITDTAGVVGIGRDVKKAKLQIFVAKWKPISKS